MLKAILNFEILKGKFILNSSWGLCKIDPAYGYLLVRCFKWGIFWANQYKFTLKKFGYVGQNTYF